jgi:hypothetical protein
LIINIVIITFVLYIIIPKYKIWKCKVVYAYLWALYCWLYYRKTFKIWITIIKIINRFYFLFGINWWKYIFSRFKIFCVWTILNFFYFIINYWIYLYKTKCIINILVKIHFNIWKYARWIISWKFFLIKTINKIRSVLLDILNFIIYLKMFIDCIV